MAIRKQMWWAALTLMFCLASQPAFSQGLTAVSGVVTDPALALVPGVKVTITNSSTGFELPVMSNEKGSYSASQLLPGTYKIRAESGNFKTLLVRIVLPVNGAVILNLPLDIGASTTVIEVTAPTELFNNTNAELGTAFDRQRITGLPLNARNIVGLLVLNPGVSLSDKAGEFEREDGGQDAGARNDQQNIVLDRININQQEGGGALEGAIPTTLDSVQEFIVQTAGFGISAGWGSGAQVQLVTRSGSNTWHGSAYEFYRTTGTSARNYFSPDPTPSPLIRHIPGVSAGGPIVKDKLLFFGTYEHNSDRSSTLVSRSVPTLEFLNGIVRYQRKDGTFGVITDGPGGMLEQYTLIPGDRWNSNLIGTAGILEQFRPFSADKSRTLPSTIDNGANILTYRFNAPFIRNRNVYISRIDYNINSRNNVYVRGTLNDDVRTLSGGAETLPGFNNARTHIDNSKGFAANWNSTISSNLTGSFSTGLTRESFEDTGNAVSNYSPRIFTNLVQTAGASRQAINTWNAVGNLSWLKESHAIEIGVNYRFIDNYLRSSDIANPPLYDSAANVTANAAGSALSRALGAAEFANVAVPNNLGDALLVATGSASRFSERVQFDPQGQRLPAASPFVRNFRLQEWEFFVGDTWKINSNVNLSYGLHYAIQTPPYERNGVQVNWTEDLGQRWREMRNTTKTSDQFSPLAVQLAGRGNQLPDFYTMDTNDWAPRVSVAWLPGFDNGLLGTLARKGGQLVVRAGYALLYDRIGGRFARDAATLGSIGLLVANNTPGSSFSVDGSNGTTRAPRIGVGGSLPRDQFPFVNQSDFKVPSVTAGPGSLVTTGIDPGLHSPANHLVNFTISKELPRGWAVEGSYVGRFARNLLGQVDIAAPPNVRDTVSGMTWYEATNSLFTQYMGRGAAVSDVQPIAWFENVYPEMKGFVEGKLGRTFTSATQAWYAYLLQQSPTGPSLTPGPNVAISQFDRLRELEVGLGRDKLFNPQAQSFMLVGNFSRSNYNAAEFSGRKRFGQGFSLGMNYTLSKSMDLTSAAEARGFRPNKDTSEGIAADPLNPGLSYALSDFDRRHQFNSSFLADLPFGRGKWLGRDAGPALNLIIGGWKVSGIGIAASGKPWSFTAANRFDRHFVGSDQPLVIAPIPYELTKQNGRVFLIAGSATDRANIAANNFANSYPGGPVGRNQGRGPGYWNVDFAVTKQFDIGSNEGRKLSLRWEAFNLFNHPNFNVPAALSSGGRNIGVGSTLGEVTTTLGTERVMQFSLRMEF